MLLNELDGRMGTFINFEGNLSFEHCGASRFLTDHYTEKQFVDFGFMEWMSDISQEKEKSALCRVQWIKEASPLAIYRTAKSIVKISKIGLKDMWASSQLNKCFVCGSKNKNKYGDLECVTIPDAGHFMLIDNPKACHEVIKNKIERTRF